MHRYLDLRRFMMALFNSPPLRRKPLAGYFDYVLAVFALFLLIQSARAIELNLKGDQYWLVLASRQDTDQAIASARRFSRLKPLVVSSANGWLAVIAGPNFVKNGEGQKFIQASAKENFTPGDAYLTKGAGFKEILWTTPPTPVMASVEYDGEKDATLKSGDFDITLSRRTIDKEEAVATIKAVYKGKLAFTAEMPNDNPAEKPASAVSIVRLDLDSPAPQVVFTYYWMGAHCCTVTKIATLRPDGWAVVNGETLDGDGYWYEPSSDNSFSYLMKADNAFLYTFDSYAGSIAPTRIMKLAETKIEDVTRQPQFYHRNLQDLYSIEDIAKGNNDTLRANGYLAGWVAASALVGKGHEAWTKMLASYDHESDFGPEECTINKKIEDCPDANRIKLAFPWALREFLVKHGYIDATDDYPAPAKYEKPSLPNNAQSASVPSQLQTCIDVSDTVKKLVYQIFLGRQIRSNEPSSSVDLKDDTTLEAFDAGIQKATCAVTYELNLRPVIGHLAENGEMLRAQGLNQLIRRSGPIVHNRIKYTVKPTSSGSYIEILP